MEKGIGCLAVLGCGGVLLWSLFYQFAIVGLGSLGDWWWVSNALFPMGWVLVLGLAGGILMLFSDG